MGDKEYPGDWGSIRKEVYSRDNFECQNCGATGGPRGNVELHAHHVVPVSKGGVHELSNLQTLCKSCHDAIHTTSEAPTSDDHITVADLFEVSKCPHCGANSTRLTREEKRHLVCEVCGGDIRTNQQLVPQWVVDKVGACTNCSSTNFRAELKFETEIGETVKIEMWCRNCKLRYKVNPQKKTLNKIRSGEPQGLFGKLFSGF